MSNYKNPDIEEIIEPVKGTSRIANKIRQFKVFFLRDVLSKLANKQYMFINMLEAPVLAAILSFFVKFFNTDGKGHEDYVFYENENIPQYLFISVVVALFLGLTVAAEEIIKDKKILKRESFLNLSLGSYLWSKILIMFMVSAIQTAFFVLIGNLILEIHGLWWEYWVILFSTSCMANVLGLNISSAFNSAKVIYIIVPLLIIPQLIFSGVIVKFDKLHPIFSSNNEVPWIGNAMASRWAYEALAVTQAVDNVHEERQFDLHQKQSNASWKRDYWIPEMKNQLTILADKKSSLKDFEKAKRILSNEVEKEVSNWGNLECKDCVAGLSKLQKGKSSVQEVQFNIGAFLETLKKQYNLNYNQTTEQLDRLVLKMGEENYEASQAAFINESLQDLVTNRTEVQKIIITDDELIQKDDPLYMDPKNTRLLDAPFYTYKKYWFGIPMSTFMANVLVLWGMTILLIVALYYDLLRKFLKLFSRSGSNA